MSDYNWCHGPECHKRKTTTRVRGVKGNKVLRTMKLKTDRVGVWNYFCDQTCMHDFIYKHIQEFAQLHPRTEALETPIQDPVKETLQSNWGNYSWTKTRIKEIDNA
jgi:YHS domain-containing protein